MFKYDSGIMSFLGKVADIVILNLLTLICCIPIVTIGASLTAAHYTALKMKRDTDNYVVRNFFRSFKTNFLQSTIIWIIWVVVVALSVYAYMFYPEGGIGIILKIVMCSMLIFIAMTTMWLFPMQARFVNKIGVTIRNAFLFACRYFLRTLGMLVVTAAGVALWICLSFQFYWIPLMIGLALPIYLCAMLYDKVFTQMEEKILAEQNEGNASEKTVEQIGENELVEE